MSAGPGAFTVRGTSGRIGGRGGQLRGPVASSATDCVVRELRSGETVVVEAVFDGLTASQRYRRFHTGVVRLTRATLHHLSTPDGDRHVVMAAFRSGRPVGLARYVVTGRGRAEVAVEVVHDHTRRGVGGLLLCRLRDHAVDHGITALEMSITGDNLPAVRLARSFGVRLVRGTGGYDGTLHVDAGTSTTTNHP